MILHENSQLLFCLILWSSVTHSQTQSELMQPSKFIPPFPVKLSVEPLLAPAALLLGTPHLVNASLKF